MNMPFQDESSTGDFVVPSSSPDPVLSPQAMNVPILTRTSARVRGLLHGRAHGYVNVFPQVNVSAVGAPKNVNVVRGSGRHRGLARGCVNVLPQANVNAI